MKMLAEREEVLVTNYKRMFLERGDVTPADPLEFHLHHLVTYWSRLVGFCRLHPDHPETCVDGDLGACVKVGSDFADAIIDSASPIFESWSVYKQLADAVLHCRPVSLNDVESASTAFDQCLSAINYKPPG